MNSTKQIHTLVIGGGQAGLSVGYHLKQRGIPFLILDAHRQIGDAWRKRWDSLRLFTPGQFVSLDGLPFHANGSAFPTKDEIADYLQRYANRFQLPVRNGIAVQRLSRKNGRFTAETNDGERYEADNVIVAMADYQKPHIPAFARELTPNIVQLHSHHYRNPSQLQDGSVLVVGVGNSGADIAIEVAKTHDSFIAGKESGFIPWPIDGAFARNVLFRMIRFIGHHVLTLATPIGRRQRPKMLHRATPLIRVKPRDLVAAGIQRVPRVVGTREGRPLLADERVLDVANIIWCTGYRRGFSWIDLPIFDEHGDARHDRGVVKEAPGLFFVGLHYQYAMSSATLIGVSRDAGYVVKRISAAQKQLAAAA